MLPILLDLRGKRVLVVGGGEVGQRKARAAIAAGAIVTLVAPDPPPDDWTTAVWLQDHYRAEHIAGQSIVFAAATPAVNEQVVLDAIRNGIWVNSASDPTAGDFTLPAIVRRGELTLAVHTGGGAPALARRIRERLEAEFDAVYGTWIALLERLRPIIRERIADPHRRRYLLDDFADWRWLEHVRRVGPESTWKTMLEAIR